MFIISPKNIKLQNTYIILIEILIVPKTPLQMFIIIFFFSSKRKRKKKFP